MASNYSSSLKIQLMATGENNTTWGNVTNENLGTAIEESIVGSADVTFASADVDLTLTNTNATQTARNFRLNLTGTSGGARNLYLSTGANVEKVYVVNNGLADPVTVRNKITGTPSGTSVVVPAGKTVYLYNTGTNIVDAITHLTSLTLGSPLSVASGGTGSNTGDGSALTNLNASNITLGTLANGRTTASSSNGANTIIARDSSGNFSANTFFGLATSAAGLQYARTIEISGNVTSQPTAFDGTANIYIPVTGINGSAINSGTVANARTTASSSNGANTIVTRDASGNFSANTITASLNGTATSATVLQTARTIAIQDGVTGTATAFTGGGNISIPVTGINASYINSGSISNSVTTASSSNGANTIVARDASGNFSANLITAALIGVANSASALTPGRNISITGGATATGVTFDGSTDIALNVTALDGSTISSGTVALSRGGTGASLVDPNADRIMFWDDSSGSVDWLQLGTGLSISGTTLNASTGSGNTLSNSTNELILTTTESQFVPNIVSTGDSGQGSISSLRMSGNYLSSYFFDLNGSGTRTAADASAASKLINGDTVSATYYRAAFKSGYASLLCGLSFHTGLSADILKWVSGNPVSSYSTQTNAVVLGYSVGARVVVQNYYLNDDPATVTPTGAVISLNANITQVTGGISYLLGIVTVSSSVYSVLDTDHDVIFSTSATCTVTLPRASGANQGRELIFKTTAAFAVVSATSNVIPLAGGAAGTSILSASAGKWARIVSNGTNWVIMCAN